MRWMWSPDRTTTPAVFVHLKNQFNTSNLKHLDYEPAALLHKSCHQWMKRRVVFVLSCYSPPSIMSIYQSIFGCAVDLRTSFHLFSVITASARIWSTLRSSILSLTSVHWWQAGNDKWMMVVFTSASSMSVTVMIYNISNISNNNLLHPPS